jgi:predicted metal-binding protein
MTAHPNGDGITVLAICRTCRPEGDPASEPPGARLGRLAAEAIREQRADAVVVKAIACLSACGRSCAASVAAPGKFAYVIGGLTPNDAEDLASFAIAHAAAPDGVPPWRARPEKIRKNTLARVPPPGTAHPLVEDVSAAVDDVKEGA